MAVFHSKMPSTHFHVLRELIFYEASRLESVSSVEQTADALIVKRLPIKLTFDRSEVKADGPLRPAPPNPNSRPNLRPSRIITLIIPFSGDPELLRLMPRSRPMQSRLDQVNIHTESPEGGTLSFKLSGQLTKETIEAEIDGLLTLLNEGANQINRDVDAFETRLRSEVPQWVSERSAELGEIASINAAMTIPIHATSDQERIPIPLQPSSLQLTPVQVSSSSGSGAQWVMEQNIYNDILRLIGSTVKAMERTPTVSKLLVNKVLDEEGLRNLLLIVLNSNYHGAVAGEVFNGQGKTDVLLRWQDKNAFIGECKFWDGQSKFKDALEQLLGYTVWRDTKAALIVFLGEQKATETIEKANKVIQAHGCFESFDGKDSHGHYRYVVHSSEDVQRKIQLALVPVVLKKGVPEAQE